MLFGLHRSNLWNLRARLFWESFLMSCQTLSPKNCLNPEMRLFCPNRFSVTEMLSCMYLPVSQFETQAYSVCPSLSEVLDTLLTSALVKRDRITRKLSLHRLVQAQFKYYISPQDRQMAFDNVTQLLCGSFPRTEPKKGQLYDRWT